MNEDVATGEKLKHEEVTKYKTFTTTTWKAMGC